MQETVVPMCYLRVKPIGVMHMLDQGEQDDKVAPFLIKSALIFCLLRLLQSMSMILNFVNLKISASWLHIDYWK